MTFRKTIDLIESLTDANLAHTIAAAISSGDHEGFQPYWKLHADELILTDSDAMAHIAMHVMDGFTTGAHPHWELKVVENDQDIPYDRTHDMQANADERAMRNDIGVAEEVIDEEVIDMVHAHMVVPVAETHGPGNGWYEVSEDQATRFVVEDEHGVPVEHYGSREEAQAAADHLNGVMAPEEMEHYAPASEELELTEVDEDPTDEASMALDEPTGFEDSANFIVIINAIHERGERQDRALRELDARGLWLSSEQKQQAGLV